MIVQNRLSDKPAETASGIGRKEEAWKVRHCIAAFIMGLCFEVREDIAEVAGVAIVEIN